MTRADRYWILWAGVAVVAGATGALLVRGVTPAAPGAMALSGWLVAMLNSLAGHAINRRAVGPDRNAFVRWGLAVNFARILTLLALFAFIVFFQPEGRGAFFVMVFTCYFMLLGVEVMALLRGQDKVGRAR